VVVASFTKFDPYPLYRALDNHMLHVKCIRDHTREGHARQLLRFGVPYYENVNRLRRALGIIDECLEQTATGANRARRQSV